LAGFGEPLLRRVDAVCLQQARLSRVVAIMHPLIGVARQPDTFLRQTR
jgi:hypothetical protein